MDTRDLRFQATRPSVTNHLKNGNFIATPFQSTVVNNYPTGGVQIQGRPRTFRTRKAYAVADSSGQPSLASPLGVPGYQIPTAAPAENFLGYWDIWGVLGTMGVDSSSSFDGGNRLIFNFSADGLIQMRQKIESFDKFRGKFVTFCLSGYAGKRDAKITVALDTGAVQEGRPYFSRYFGDYSRMNSVFKVPLDCSKFEVMIKIQGSTETSVAISGAVLAIGAYSVDVPYSDCIPDLVLPSGSIVLWTGDACPAGFRSIEDDSYLLSVFGDPNSFGRTDQRNLSTRSTVGANYHDHGQSGETEAQAAAFDQSAEPLVGSIIPENTIPQIMIKYAAPPGNELQSGAEYQGESVQVIPADHTHKLYPTEDSVEPPRVKVRICEKI